jgi:hypothetical protein
MQTVKSILNFIPWTFLLIISGILYYQADLLVWALIIGYITSNFISVIHHLYWAHGYVVPKNRFIKTMLDLIGYVSWPVSFYILSLFGHIHIGIIINFRGHPRTL